MSQSIIILEDASMIRHQLKKDLSDESTVHFSGSANTLYRAYELIKDKDVDILIADAHFVLEGEPDYVHKVLCAKPVMVVLIASSREREALLTLRNQMPIHHIILKTTQGYDHHEFMLALNGYSGKEDQIRRHYHQRQADLVYREGEALIAIGASTGGVQAIESVLSQLSGNTPPILMVQHISKTFSTKMADRICKSTRVLVKEAEQGDVLRRNIAYLAPGDQHMTIKKSGQHYEIVLDDKPMVHFQRPAVDRLFQSVAKEIGERSVGVLLTGMGVDGASGLLAMREAGGYTLAQDAKSSVIFGMPKAAIELGAACEVVHLDDIPLRISELGQLTILRPSMKMIG